MLIVPRITGADVQQGSRCRVTATVTNIGDEVGEFALTGFVYSAAGPYASDSYGDPSGYYGQIQNWIGGSNSRGTSINSGWATLSPGSSTTLYADSASSLNWTGYSHVYIVGACRRPGGARLYDREHYRFFPNAFQVIVPAPPPPPPPPTPTCPTPPDPTPIRSWFQGLGCTVDYYSGTGYEIATVRYGGKSYGFMTGANAWRGSDGLLYTSRSEALNAMKYLGIC